MTKTSKKIIKKYKIIKFKLFKKNKAIKNKITAKIVKKRLNKRLEPFKNKR